MNPRHDIFRLDVVSWALYDFANTIYSMNILSLYFAGWLVVDLGYKDIHYSIAYSASMLLAAILMPAFGYLSDRNGANSAHSGQAVHPQKRLLFLFVFTVGAIISVILFSITPATVIPVILIFFGISNFFFEGGMVFYNALLYSISTEQNVGKVSGFGVSLGYLGSIVGMILVLPFVTGEVFGWNVPFLDGGGKSAAFLPTAVFYGIFAVPIFLFVREKRNKNLPSGKANSANNHGLLTAYKDIWHSLRATKKYPGLLRFLISDYFFEDAIATVIIFMAVFTERVLGMGDSDRTVFFIISTVFAMIGAYLLGLLADRLTPKKVLFGIVIGWIMILLLFAVNSYTLVFWVLGPIVGILLGGVWSVSRPLLMELTPPEKLGEFFGLFSLSGRAAAICGPMVWGVVVYLFSPDHFLGKYMADIFELGGDAADKMPYRLAVFGLATMMAVGLYIFRKVPDRKAES